MVRDRRRADDRRDAVVRWGRIRIDREQSLRLLRCSGTWVTRRAEDRMRRWRSLVWWRWLDALRRCVRDSIHTVPGRLMILLVLVSTPGVVQLLREGGPLSALLQGPSRLGALLAAQTALSACLVVMVSVMLAKRLVLRRDEEPLLAHPYCLPDLAALSVAETILGASAFLWCFFYLFYWQDLAAQFQAEEPGLSLYFGLAQLQSLSVGVLAAAAVRYALRRPGGAERAQRLQRAAVLPFLISFSFIALLPQLLHSANPSFLSEVAAAAPRFLHFLQASLAIEAARTEGASGVALAWGSALMLSAAGSWIGLSHWRRWAPLELSVATSCVTRDSKSLRFLPFPSEGPALLRQVTTFWSKDVLAGEPKGRGLRFTSHVVVCLSVATALAMAVVAAPSVGVGTAHRWSPGSSEVLVACLTGLVSVRTLGCLGQEGAGFGLLRLAMPTRRLLWVKFCVNLAYVLAWMPAYVVGIAALMGRGGSYITTTVTLMAVGITYGIILVVLGSGLGFLLPDLKKRSLLLPGASRAGQCLFFLLAAVPLLGMGTSLGPFLSLALILPSSVMAWAMGLRRAQGMEL